MPHPPQSSLLRILEIAEHMIRSVASRLHLPGRDRLDLHRIADMLADALHRAGRR